MEPIKFWAETEQDTENFFNYLQAHGLKEDLSWTKKNTMPKPLANMGWYVYEESGLAYSSPGEHNFFDKHPNKEFFFPIPGDEFVETSELDGQIPDEEIPKHSHYKKNVEHLKFIDVYRVLDLYEVTHSAIAHAVKKLLVAGGRGAGKNIAQDIDEAIDSLLRWKEMRDEEQT